MSSVVTTPTTSDGDEVAPPAHPEAAVPASAVSVVTALTSSPEAMDELVAE
jgi:hypothetical protein